jgi:hypothetical protein
MNDVTEYLIQEQLDILLSNLGNLARLGISAELGDTYIKSITTTAIFLPGVIRLNGKLVYDPSATLCLNNVDVSAGEILETEEDEWEIDEEIFPHICSTCGAVLQIVRPGKYQCVSCDCAVEVIEPDD